MSRVIVSPNTLHQEIEGEAVLLHLESETYFSLDEIGTRIWQLLERHGDVERIAAEMLNEYDVEESQLREDIERMVRDLTEAGLVTVESGEPK